MSHILRGKLPSGSPVDTRPLVLPPLKACASVLPGDAVQILRGAAAVDPGVPASYSGDRRIAVARAIQRVKFLYPNFFQH